MVQVPADRHDLIHHVSASSGEILDSKLKPEEYEENGSKSFVRSFTHMGQYRYIFFISRKQLHPKFYLNRIKEDDGLHLFYAGLEFYRKQGYEFPSLRNIWESGWINDIDFAFDFLENNASFDNRIKKYKELNSHGRTFFTSPNKYTTQKLRIGIQYGNRNVATFTDPFIKFYSKYWELIDRSKEYHQYLTFNGIAVSPYHRRLEGTIKNKAHLENVFKIVFKKPVPDNKTLLLLPERDIRDICIHLAERHLNYVKTVHIREVKDELSPTDYVLGLMARKLVEDAGYSLRNIVNFLPVEQYSATAKSRLKQRIINGFVFHQEALDILDLRVSSSDAFI